jgi:hypothetical protein
MDLWVLVLLRIVYKALPSSARNEVEVAEQ